MLFIESPAGVGYSYSSDGNITTNDDIVCLHDVQIAARRKIMSVILQTAQDNYHALIYFFTNKFPELRSNDFYITGESYAGVYLPTLGSLLVQDTVNFPTFRVS